LPGATALRSRSRAGRWRLQGATTAGRPLRRRQLLLGLGGDGLGQRLPSEARLERRDQVGRRGPRLDLDALDVLTRDLLFDRLQEPLPILVLVVLGLELCPGELADQPLGEGPLLVADLRCGALVDLGRVVDLAREVEPLEEKSLLVHPNRDRRGLPTPRERADGNPMCLLERLD
jgi:hypothetical protein